MKFQIYKPTYSSLTPFLKHQAERNYNYSATEGTKSPPVKGYDNDHSFIVLGDGEVVWEKAKAVLQSWQQFPSSWTKVEPNSTPLEKGKVVAVLFRLFGLWFINSARIVYTLNSDKQYGFAYGTLPGHVEKGEECFWIERDASGQVTYHIRAFSQPACWIVWLGYPIARYFQRRFVKQSLAHMKKCCNEI